jgi:hypothetical protein
MQGVNAGIVAGAITDVNAINVLSPATTRLTWHAAASDTGVEPAAGGVADATIPNQTESSLRLGLDSFTLAVDAGQTITVRVTPAHQRATEREIRDAATCYWGWGPQRRQNNRDRNRSDCVSGTLTFRNTGTASTAAHSPFK